MLSSLHYPRNTLETPLKFKRRIPTHFPRWNFYVPLYVFQPLPPFRFTNICTVRRKHSPTISNETQTFATSLKITISIISSKPGNPASVDKVLSIRLHQIHDRSRLKNVADTWSRTYFWYGGLFRSQHFFAKVWVKIYIFWRKLSIKTRSKHIAKVQNGRGYGWFKW